METKDYVGKLVKIINIDNCTIGNTIEVGEKAKVILYQRDEQCSDLSLLVRFDEEITRNCNIWLPENFDLTKENSKKLQWFKKSDLEISEDKK